MTQQSCGHQQQTVHFTSEYTKSHTGTNQPNNEESERKRSEVRPRIIQAEKEQVSERGLQGHFASVPPVAAFPRLDRTQYNCFNPSLRRKAKLTRLVAFHYEWHVVFIQSTHSTDTEGEVKSERRHDKRLVIEQLTEDVS